jgi:hypothetical protein
MTIDKKVELPIFESMVIIHFQTIPLAIVTPMNCFYILGHSPLASCLPDNRLIGTPLSEM